MAIIALFVGGLFIQTSNSLMDIIGWLGMTGTLYPFPKAPYCWLPLVSALYFLVGAFYYRHIKLRVLRGQAIERTGAERS